MASETRQDPERIYLEPAPYSPEGRLWCADDVWPLDGDGPGGVEYVRADLATPEPGGEGEVLYRKRCGWCGAYEGTVDPREPCATDGTGFIGPHQFGVLEKVEPPTPAAGEDVRERVVWLLSQWEDELVAHWEDPEEDEEPPGVGQIADEILALLRTPRGEGEAMDADAMWYHWSSGHEVAALQGLRAVTDDEAHRFLSMLADWQRCPMPSDHDAIAARRGEGGGDG